MDYSIYDRISVFEKNYDIVFDYVHGLGNQQYISDPYYKVCRFCGKRLPEVKFRKKAHAISEFLGNKEIILNNECDVCNEQFGVYLEDHLAKYLGVARTISQIHGKTGVPAYKDSIIFDKDIGTIIKYKRDTDVSIGNIKELVKNDFIKFDNHKANIHTVRDSYIPIAVYKAFVKIALSLLPYKYLVYFIETIAWIKERSHIVSRFFDLVQYAYVIERVIPGIPLVQLKVKGFIRKDSSVPLPFFQFFIEFSNYSYQLAIPCPEKDLCLNQITLNRFPGTDEILEIQEYYELKNAGKNVRFDDFKSSYHQKYGDPMCCVVDMRSNIKQKNKSLDVELSFETSEELKWAKGMTINDFLSNIKEDKTHKLDN